MLSAGMRLIQGGLGRCPPGWAGRNDHEDRLKIWIPLSGEAAHAVGDEWIRARPGEVYFIPGGRGQTWRSERGLEVYWFHARPESLALDHRLARAAPMSWPRRRWAHWRGTWERLPEYFRDRDPGLGLRLQALAAEVAAEVLESLPAAPSQPQADRLERFAPALALIDEGFVRGLPMSVLAASAKLSVVHFHREFKRLFRTTPHDYMLRRRMELAQRHLRDGEESVAAIAARCGYDDAFYFARVFRRVVGCSPTAYRASPHPAGP